jgi:hypothetical protein
MVLKDKNIILLAVFIFAIACSPQQAKKVSQQMRPAATESKEPQIEHKPELEIDGQYLAILETLNEVVSQEVTGAVTISREDDEFVGDVYFLGGPLTASVLHMQSVHEGTKCPTMEDDLNQDGFIDAVEGEMVYGKVLIPLDADLNAQHLELGTYPVADQYGLYVYSSVASYERFITDLKAENLNPNGYLTKLKPDEKLELEGKVVIIKGVSRAALLPDTVQSNSRWPNHQTIPIACGVMQKVRSTPGIIDRDEPRSPPSSEMYGGPAGIDDGTIIVPPTSKEEEDRGYDPA